MTINPSYKVPEARHASIVSREAGSHHEVVRHGFEASFRGWISRDPLANAEMSQGPNLYEYVRNNPDRYVDPLGLWWWYGNYGGPNWNNGTNRSEEDPIIPPSDPRYKPPKDARDACYQQHDICLNKCQYIKCPADRQKCRHSCDNALSDCLSKVPNHTGTMGAEEWLFGGTNTPNNNPGTYSPGK